MNFKLGGRPVSSPLAKLFVILVLIVWLPLTLPLHVIVWLFNGRGFIKRNGRSWNYEPPAWAAILSLAAVPAVVALLV